MTSSARVQLILQAANASLQQSLGECIRPSDTVAIVLHDDLCGFAALLAATHCCACSPINPALTAMELRADLLEVGAAAVILAPDADGTKSVAEELGMLWIEAAVTGEGCSWRPGPRSPVARRRANQPDNGGAKLLLHTSATTGRRKVVSLSGANLQAMSESSCRVLELDRSDRLLNMARLFHTQGILSPLAQLLAGGSVVFLGAFTIRSFRDVMEDLQPTWYTCGPTLHRTILTNLQQQPFERPVSLRFVRSGGSPLPPTLRLDLERVLQVPALDVYGLTEVGGAASTTPGFHERHHLRPDSPCVGVSMGPEIAVLTRQGDLLAPGEEGEIAIGGPSVMMGYRHDEAADGEVFCNGWFRTGDLGRLDPGGLLFVTGRLKEIINRGGQKIVPGEIDTVLRTHPAVREVAAFGVPHPTLGEDVACAVVLEPGSHASANDLRSFVGLQLARYKIPRTIHFLDQIPCGATGKPQRLLLKEQFAHRDRSAPRKLRARSRVHLSKPVSDCQVTLPGSSQPSGDGTCHRRARAAMRTSSARGGDSVSAVILLVEVEEVFGLTSALSQADFFDCPTLARLTALTVSALAGDNAKVRTSTMECLKVRDAPNTIPLFLIAADGDEGSYFRRLARRLGPEFSLALLRPENSWHRASMYAIHDAAAEAVALIRRTRPHGPYVLGGFCYGGVVAFEIARLLEAAGERVLLVFFDVPMPGCPHPLRDPLVFARLGLQGTKLAWAAGDRQLCTSLLRRVAVRLLWILLRQVRSCPGPGQTPPFLRRLGEQARTEYFPLYRPLPTSVPLHHFIAGDQGDPLRAQSRHGWRRVCSSGVTATRTPGGHQVMLSEGNLPLVTGIMSAWLLKELGREPPSLGARTPVQDIVRLPPQQFI